jgi:imidazolonepropionase-like amidohydrolase
MTLLPGLIEGHSHILLHPYNETSWNDQVLHEPLALRVARSVNHARRTLEAGFTTIRDLGTEGPPRPTSASRRPSSRVSCRAADAGGHPRDRRDGTYGPRGFDPRWDVPQGAEEASGLEEITRVTRRQIANGADWIKVYADYRWGASGEAVPRFRSRSWNGWSKRRGAAAAGGRPCRHR